MKNYEKYGFQTIETKNYIAYCNVYNNRSGFVHECRLELKTPVKLKNGALLQAITKKCQYYNRTWENWHFESVVLKCVDELPKKEQENARKEFEAYARGESAELTEKLENFQQNYAELTEKQKELLKNVEVTNKSEFNSVCSLVGMMSIFNKF